MGTCSELEKNVHVVRLVVRRYCGKNSHLMLVTTLHVQTLCSIYLFEGAELVVKHSEYLQQPRAGVFP